MRVPAAAKKKPRIEIIPMIDTMFFLLVFFMIATLSMTMQHGMPVNLPEAISTTNKVQQPVSLTITENGDLFYNKDMITIHELQTRLLELIEKDADPTIVINADEHVEHGLVVKVMDKVRLSGIPNMAIATEPETTP